MTASERIREARASSYLSQLVHYGGEWRQIGSLYEELGDAAAGAWLAGYTRGGHPFHTIDTVPLFGERI